MRYLCCCLLSFVTLCVYSQYNVDKLLMSGRIALHYEDYVLSIQYFNQAINQKPFLWEPWQLRAVAKFYLEDWQGAELDATEAIERNPYISSLYDLRGISRIRQEEYEKAIHDYTKAIEIEPNNRNFWYNRAICYMECKNYDMSHLQLDTIISRWSNYAAPYLVKAELFLNQEDTLRAEEYINKSIKIDAYDASSWKMLANIALARQQWEQSEEYLDKAIQYKPKETGCYINRALARLHQNNLRGAMSDYDMALELSPNNFLAHYNRGLLRQRVGDDNRAIEDFDYVLSIEPGNIMALFNRAILLDRVGDLKAAVRDYSLVIDKFPNFWTGLQYRANCYRRLGMIAKAERDEFRILKAQMDKRLGMQQRWSSGKLSAMRKLSDIDPEKYSDIVVDDDAAEEHEYKSEYRGKVQNKQISEQFQPYIALTIASSSKVSLAHLPYVEAVNDFTEKIRQMKTQYPLPVLGRVGGGSGAATFSLVDSISVLMDSRKEPDVDMLLMRSIAYSTGQNYSDALKDIDRVLSVQPDNVIAQWQRTICMAMLAEYESAQSTQENAMRNNILRKDFEKLISSLKDNIIVMYNEATYYARMGEYEKSLDIYTKVIDMDNTFSYAYYNRAMVYLHMDSVVNANNDLSKAGELGLYGAYSLMKRKK